MEPEADKLRDARIAMWVAEERGQPFAFIQDYAVADWFPHHFDYLPPGSRGMDVYIGEKAMLGLGHGSRVVKQHVEGLFSRGIPAVGIDPHPENGPARRAFEKAGFSVSGGPLDTKWDRAVLMDRYS